MGRPQDITYKVSESITLKRDSWQTNEPPYFFKIIETDEKTGDIEGDVFVDPSEIDALIAGLQWMKKLQAFASIEGGPASVKLPNAILSDFNKKGGL